jgi:hypothetical protein
MRRRKMEAASTRLNKAGHSPTCGGVSLNIGKNTRGRSSKIHTADRDKTGNDGVAIGPDSGAAGPPTSPTPQTEGALSSV